MTHKRLPECLNEYIEFTEEGYLVLKSRVDIIWVLDKYAASWKSYNDNLLSLKVDYARIATQVKVGEDKVARYKPFKEALDLLREEKEDTPK